MKRVGGHRLNFPSLMGAYLVVNAIPDAYLLVDGPDCALYKTHFIHGRHDLNSTLLSIDGRHRVCFTNVCAQSVTRDHNELVFRRLQRINGFEEAGLILLTALPSCSLTGIDYEHLLSSVRSKLLKPALAIPPISLAGDWIDGYATTLLALARRMELPDARPEPDKVALVGYMMDRNEGDHRANLEELRRLLGALSLELVSVWPGGAPYAALREAARAGLVVSLPYGREAAAELARRTGATLVEAELPFGLRATERFLRKTAEAAGRPEAAERVVREEVREAFSRLEWIAPHLFFHRTASYFGDPCLIGGFLELCDDLGMRVLECSSTGREGHLSLPEGVEKPPLHFEPDYYHPAVQRLRRSPPDLVVSNTNEALRNRPPHDFALVELGFPSYYHHAVGLSPFLGYRGALAFVERLADALSSLKRNAVAYTGPFCQ